MDLVAAVPRLPIAGETLLGHNFFQASGGKGANQAVALAKLSIPTQMVGACWCRQFWDRTSQSIKSLWCPDRSCIGR